MPSEKVLQSKKEIVADLTNKFSNAASCVIVDYKGINVADDTKLRKDLREADVDYFVVKNTLLKFAVKETGHEALVPALEGTTAVALSSDEVAPARIISKFIDDHKDSSFSIKTGFVGDEIMDAAKLTAIGKLPSKEVLVAMVLGGLQATISGFARAINAVAEKQGAPVEEA